MNKLRITLGIQLLIFAGWAGYLLSARNTASPEFYLETVPVDPRDLISGTYVALSYEIADPKAPNCSAMPGHYYYVKLESRGKTAVTAQGPVQVYEAVDCSRDPYDKTGWALTSAESRAGAARYGIERFFLNENDPRKDARSGSVLAKVKLGKSNQLQLLDLVAKTDVKPEAKAAPGEEAKKEAQPAAKDEVKPETELKAKEELPGPPREAIKEGAKFESLILKSAN